MFGCDLVCLGFAGSIAFLAFVAVDLLVFRLVLLPGIVSGAVKVWEATALPRAFAKLCIGLLLAFVRVATYQIWWLVTQVFEIIWVVFVGCWNKASVPYSFGFLSRKTFWSRASNFALWSFIGLFVSAALSTFGQQIIVLTKRCAPQFGVQPTTIYGVGIALGLLMTAGFLVSGPRFNKLHENLKTVIFLTVLAGLYLSIVYAFAFFQPTTYFMVVTSAVVALLFATLLTMGSMKSNSNGQAAAA